MQEWNPPVEIKTTADKPVGVVPIVSSEIVRPIAVEIVKALKNPRVLRWTTWDVFAGRQINHERGLSQEEAVIEVLKRHWPNVQAERPAKNP